MPERKTTERARKAKRQGKAPTTQAGEFVREEMHHMKTKKHPVKNKKQAVAIGLSKARRSGVKVPRKKAGSINTTNRRSSSSGRTKTKA